MKARRGFALIELVVVLLLILVGMGAYFGLRGKMKAAPGELKGERSTSGVESIPLRAMQKAESLACKSNLQQLRQSIQMDADSSGQYPARIDQGAMASISTCPDTKQPYSYDPRTGRVWCTTPGHERY